MEKAEVMGPSLPLYAALPTIAVLFFTWVLVARKTSSAAGRFLIFVIGARAVLGSLHQYTFKASPTGQSWNALASIAVVGCGLLIVRRHSFSVRLVLPLAPLIVVAIASAFYNHQQDPLTSYVVKMSYFAVIAMAVIDLCGDIGLAGAAELMLWPLSAPLIFQLVGLPLGVVKAGEADGSVSYIGGFYHEAAFATLLLGTLTCACFADQIKLRYQLLFIAWSAVGILLADYRTAILAACPLVTITILARWTERFVPAQRILVIAALLLIVGGAGLSVSVTQRERFADLSVVIEKGSDLIKPTGDFSEEDRKVMSARPLIWSGYIYAYRDGDPIQHVVGFGVESWVGKFNVYAHNTLISALYELGWLGVLLYCFMWTFYLALALINRSALRWRLVAAHFTFGVLNMATMPMWMVEGLILYGIICGVTLASAFNCPLWRSHRSGSKLRSTSVRPAVGII